MLTFLFYLFIVFSSILTLYYLFIFSAFSFSKLKEKKEINLPVSILICAKNESENLTKFLPYIVTQNYPNFEIVLINDASFDDTLTVMKRFAKQHKNIKIVNVENNETFSGNKKHALTLGIKAATNDYLLFTDADCKPASNQWVYNMMRNFSVEKKFVLGYGAYQKQKKSILNALVRFETLLTAIQYFSYAKIGSPYMGVGRNLAYHKSEFFNANGFTDHLKIKSGDDDLFINQNAKGKHTAIEYTTKSHTISIAPQSFKQWYIQKRRHTSTAKYYKFKDQLLLGLFYISTVIFWLSFTFLISFLFQWELVLLIFGIKLSIQYFVYGFGAKKLNEQRLVVALPFLELFLILFQFTIFINNCISKPKHWK